MSDLIDKFGRNYTKDSIIFFEHEGGEELFVVHSGEVRIIKISGGVEKTLAILRAGDIFGEMSLLEGKPRTATAVAQTDATLMAFNKASFEVLLKSQPQFAFKLAEVLGRRIVEAHLHLENLSIDPPKARLAHIILWKMAKTGNKYCVPMSAREVAEYAGLKERDFYDVLADVIKSKKIEVYENRIELTDRAGIERMARTAVPK